MKTIKEPMNKFSEPENAIYHLPCRKGRCQALLEVSWNELQHEVLGRVHSFICPHCNEESIYDSMLLSTFKVPHPAGKLTV